MKRNTANQRELVNSALLDAGLYVFCKCGRRQFITNADRTICSWCGKRIYKDTKTKFKYEMRERLCKQR